MTTEELLAQLQSCADDPMWAHHAEILKSTCRAAIAALSNRTIGESPKVAALSPPARGLTDAEIRAAILAYYDALDSRQHGGVAMEKAFRRIEQAMEMHWEPQSTLKVGIGGQE